MDKHKTSKCDIIVNEQERSLIEHLREIAYGRVVIFIENNRPIRIEEIRESKKL